MVKELVANKAETAKKKLSSFYKTLFENSDTNKAGSAVLVDLFRFCNMDKSSFCPGDPYLTAYNEGARRVFLRVLGMLRMDERDIEDLMKQVKENERERFEW